MTRRKKTPQLKVRSYDTNLDLYETKINICSTADVPRILNEDETIDRLGFDIELDLVSDDIDEIRKKIHLLTYIRNQGEK